MRITPKALLMCALTAVLAAGLMSAPAQAYTKAEKRAEQRQNRAVKQTRTSVKALKKSTKATNGALLDLAKAVGAAAGQLTSTTAETKKNSDTLAAVIPAVTGALTQLKDGLTAAGAGIGQLKTGLEAAGAGITQLKTGLEAAGAGLTQLKGGLETLGSAYGSVEYGAVRLYRGDAGTTGNENLTAVQAVSANSADIPDDSNGALVTATVPFPATAATRLTLRAAIRSAEADGEATGDPAGQVAGIFYAKCLGETCAGGNLEAGEIACNPSGPPGPTTFPDPIGSQPVVNVQTKAPRVGFRNPTATDTNPTGGDCTLPGPGLYELTFNVQFFDFPTSSTPGPKD